MIRWLLFLFLFAGNSPAQPEDDGSALRKELGPILDRFRSEAGIRVEVRAEFFERLPEFLPASYQVKLQSTRAEGFITSGKKEIPILPDPTYAVALQRPDALRGSIGMSGLKSRWIPSTGPEISGRLAARAAGDLVVHIDPGPGKGFDAKIGISGGSTSEFTARIICTTSPRALLGYTVVLTSPRAVPLGFLVDVGKLGRLPFNTQVAIPKDELCSGVVAPPNRYAGEVDLLGRKKRLEVSIQDASVLPKDRSILASARPRLKWTEGGEPRARESPPAR